MGKRIAFIISLTILLFASCNLSSIFGGSAILVNNSDSEVTATIDETAVTIAPRDESQMISINKDNIRNNRITVSLDGIYYEETAREYNVADRISLNPDCGWINIRNSTGNTLNELSVRGSYPRITQSFDDSQIITDSQPNGNFFVLVSDFSSGNPVLSFTADNTPLSLEIDLSSLDAEEGKTVQAEITAADGTFTISGASF